MPADAFPYNVTPEVWDRPLSAAMQRQAEARPTSRPQENPLFTNFKYTPLEGFDYHGGDGTVSRRDASKVIRENGRYYVWYTHRQTPAAPVGMGRAKEATDTIPSADWDLAEVWYATSDDGFVWEEKGVAVPRPPEPQVGWRSVCTPDILKWGGRFYLYYQAFLEPSGLRGDYCPVCVSSADSPDGPWTAHDGVVLPNGAEGEWDEFAIHDPYPLVHDGQIYIYYKSVFNRPGHMWLGQGLATSADPLGPFEKHPLNPVINSGHETALFPFRGGVAAMVIRDGTEHYTMQYAEDWVNFEVASICELMPTAAGLYVPDAFDDTGDGQGVTWGLSHFVNAGGPATSHSMLARFDCDLRANEIDPLFKSTTYLHRPEVYFGQPLPEDKRRERAADARNDSRADT
ncbi:MAG: glycoside hydrolase [Planctomycetota bacterium]